MFQGYSQETVDFMWGIRFNNERGWFLAHKDDYQQHLLAPTRELGQDSSTAPPDTRRRRSRALGQASTRRWPCWAGSR